MVDTRFPDVPFTQGVPAVQRVVGQIAQVVSGLASLMTADSPVFGLFQDGDSQWGLFDQDGQPVIDAEVTYGMDYRREFRVADFPIEDGKFASYNKVQLPYDVRMTFVQAESVDSRSGFLQQVDDICNTLDLFTAVTPEASYDNVNVTGYEYRRSTHSGVSMLTVEVYCREVRLVKQGQFSDTKQDPAAVETQNQGAVSTAEPNVTQSSSALIATSDGRRDRDSVLVRDGRRDQG